MPRSRTLWIAVFCLGMPVAAVSFQLNPLNRSFIIDPSHDRFTRSLVSPVHEIITRQARRKYLDMCAKESDGLLSCDANEKPQRKTIQDSLVRGVWWNDDPSQDLYKGRLPWWFAHMHDGHSRAVGDVKINDDYMMQYRSHYGDMQFLHSMASRDGESGQETKKNIMVWGEFTYKVSTGEISSSAKFKDVGVRGLEIFFGGRHAEWEIRWILQPRYLLRYTPRDFEDHALGSLLHMIQDSFSAAHVSRSFKPTPKCLYGTINQFESYTRQDPNRHGEADTWAAYATTSFLKDAGPVDVSARLIAYSRRRASWTAEVRPYLETIVYCFDGAPAEGGPGDFR